MSKIYLKYEIPLQTTFLALSCFKSTFSKTVCFSFFLQGPSTHTFSYLILCPICFWIGWQYNFRSDLPSDTNQRLSSIWQRKQNRGRIYFLRNHQIMGNLFFTGPQWIGQRFGCKIVWECRRSFFESDRESYLRTICMKCDWELDRESDRKTNVSTASYLFRDSSSPLAVVWTSTRRAVPLVATAQ